MPKIEFIYERTCPNIADARESLRAALAQLGLPRQWQEWEHSDPDAPEHARRFGSPTILVDGRDVAGEPPSDDPSCRIYSSEPGRNRGVPGENLIMSAFQKNLPPKTESRVATGATLVSFLPAAGAALLPKLTCPACWPAYAALLSSLGVGFVDYTPWLFPATAVFLLVTLVLLAWRPRRGYAPLALGIAASAVVLVGKYYFDSDETVYSGVILLAAASAWNAWPKKTVLSCEC